MQNEVVVLHNNESLTLAWLLLFSSRPESKKKRYSEKLKVIDGMDPYEIPRESWIDDVDLWPAITQIHVGLYLLLNPSP